MGTSLSRSLTATGRACWPESPRAPWARGSASTCKHLQAHSLGDKEALHGLRAGGALSLALQGQSLADIMLQGFWAQPASARHYVGLLAEVAGEEFVRAVRHHHGDAFVNTALEPTKGPDGPFSFLANQ